MKKILVVILLSVIQCTAQNITTRHMVWGTHFGEYRFNSNLSVNLDAQFRYEYTDGDIFQWLIRPGISYKLNSGWILSGGPSFFGLYPNPNGAVPRPEIRPWEELARKWQFSNKHLVWPRIRFEQRFIREYAGSQLADEFTYHSFRIRVRCDYTYLLGEAGQEKWFFTSGNEAFFQWKADGFSSFDQNRAWAGFGYKLSPSFSVQLTYLNLVQQRNSSNLDIFHVIRPGIIYAFTQKQKEKAP